MPKTAVKPSMNGFINLYKPSGITSMDALRRIKRLSGQKRKVGHGGTMDPLAKGVLPVCFGQATRLMDYVVGGRKKYLMEVLFGVTTATYDKEGEVTATRDASGLTLPQVEDALSTFDGVIDQLPPMYSAIKVGGQRLYKLARAGVEVERKSREVEIHDIRTVRADLPTLVLEVECGKGLTCVPWPMTLGSCWVAALMWWTWNGFPAGLSKPKLRLPLNNWTRKQPEAVRCRNTC